MLGLLLGRLWLDRMQDRGNEDIKIIPAANPTKSCFNIFPILTLKFENLKIIKIILSIKYTSFVVETLVNVSKKRNWIGPQDLYCWLRYSWNVIYFSGT